MSNTLRRLIGAGFTPQQAREIAVHLELADSESIQDQFDQLARAQALRDDQQDEMSARMGRAIEGMQAPADGKSAYALWLENGNTGSLADFMASLRGDRGERGERGAAGGDGAPGRDGAAGPAGVAGPKGDAGAPGPAGAAGRDGAAGPRGEAGATGLAGATGAAGAAGATLVGTATITETATVAISAGVRKVNVPIQGVSPGQNILVFPAGATPNGYAVHDAICVTANQLQVSLTAPVLATGASYSIPVRVVRINT